jgi:hypothetical protein
MHVDESEERILCARDHLEQYVMVRLGDFAFQATQQKNLEDDLLLLKRMQLLSFLTPEVSLYDVVLSHTQQGGQSTTNLAPNVFSACCMYLIWCMLCMCTGVGYQIRAVE